MNEKHIQEQLSKAYAQAIAANAGIIFRDYGASDYGIDGRFSEVRYIDGRARYVETGFGIDVQLKATTSFHSRDDFLLYDIDVKNYKDLIATDAGTSRILIVYFMPPNKEDWVSVSCENAILKKSAWWCSLKGSPDTSNVSKIRIEIPKSQLLTPEELTRLMEHVKGGAKL